MSDDDTQEPKLPVEEASDNPKDTPRVWDAPDGRPHIDDIDAEQVNIKSSNT